MSDNQLQKTNRQVSVKSLIESPAYSSRLSKLMGEKAQGFISSLVQISQSRSLENVDPNSIIASAMIAGALDLPINPNLGFAFIVPYKGVATFQIGYKGLVQLAMRSGQYKRLNVTQVYDGELIKYDRVKGDVILDETKRTAGDKVIGYVAYFELVNGAEHAEYWSVDTVKKHAERFSQAFKNKKYDSPWTTDFDRMAMKTVLKSLLSHWGPLSVQMQSAVVEDQGSRKSMDDDLTYPDNGDVEERPPELVKKIDKPKKAAVTVEAGEQPKDAPAPADSPMTPEGVKSAIFDVAKVSFDDFQDFVENQGICKNIRSFPSVDDCPSTLWTTLAEAPAMVSKIVKLYGNS